MITVSLTQEEIAERARSLAQYANKLAELSDEEEGAKARHKQLMADIKERRLDISNELRRLSRAVRLGVEERATQQVFWEEERRLEEFRREQDLKRRAEEAIQEGEELIERQQQAEMEEEASRGAVAEFFGGNEDFIVHDLAHEDSDGFTPGFPPGFDPERAEQGLAQESETEEDRRRYWAEWREGLSQEERDKHYTAPCSCGHQRDWHLCDEIDGACSLCVCGMYHCPDCDTKGGHKAACEHYILGEGTPVQKESQADDFTAARCDECKMIEGGHAQTCSKSNALTFGDYLAYARAHYKTNHQSHARKMELTKLKDDEVRAWKQQQAGSGAEAEPEPKKKGRKKLSPVEAAIDR